MLRPVRCGVARVRRSMIVRATNKWNLHSVSSDGAATQIVCSDLDTLPRDNVARTSGVLHNANCKLLLKYQTAVGSIHVDESLFRFLRVDLRRGQSEANNLSE